MSVILGSKTEHLNLSGDFRYDCLRMLSVLIVNWNTRDLLRACLNSLARYAPDVPFEAIIVDNASNDLSAETISRQFPWAKVVRSDQNSGYAAGNNRAFSMAQGDYLLTLNPDTEFEDNTLSLAINELEKRPDCGCLSVKLIGPDGGVQKSVRGFPSLLGIFGDITKLGHRFPRSIFGSYRLDAFDYETSQYAPQPMGTFILFRRSALEAVGDARAPFDEQFPIFFNDVDLLKRLRRKGFKCWYCAEGHVRHVHGAGTSQMPAPSMIWESHNSLVRYLRKHLTGPRRLLLPLIAAASNAVARRRAKVWHAGFGS